MTGAKSSNSSGRLASTLWAIASAWLLGSLVGLGACVGISTFSGGMKNLLSLTAQSTANVLSIVARALNDYPVIGVGVLVGGILGVVMGRRRPS
jgi:uncharacterized membrane protein